MIFSHQNGEKVRHLKCAQTTPCQYFTNLRSSGITGPMLWAEAVLSYEEAMGHWWISIGMSIGLVMLWGGLCLRAGASCGRKRELHIREVGQDKEGGAGSEEDAVLCQTVFQERLEVESERAPWPVIEEVGAGLEVRLGGEEGCDQEREPLAEMEPRWEEMKWVVHWPQPGWAIRSIP